MIPKVSKIAVPGRLMRYLVGPGEENEHVFPHLVAGPEALMAGYDGGELTYGEAAELAAWIEAPRLRFGVEVTAPRTVQDAETGVRLEVGRTRENIWHCSLAVGAPEGDLGDERWRQVAEEFVAGMGLAGVEGKADCRWVAVHHGRSENGNDHIHLVASTVREDGTKWEGRYRDYRTAQAVCRGLEEHHGLVRLTGPAAGISERGSNRAETDRAARSGSELTAPQQLAQSVRAAALASTSEAEFVRRVRAEGIVIKPRYEKGSTESVVGYRVALPAERNGGQWRFYGGGTIGRDLSLPRLRETWPSPDKDTAAGAVGEWAAAHAGRAATIAGGREAQPVAAVAEVIAAQRWAGYNEHLKVLPDTASAGWADAARQTSAALGAWAAGQEGPGSVEIARAARVLARSAQQSRPGRRGGQEPGAGMAATVVLASRRLETQGVLGAELVRSVELIRDHHSRLGQFAEAARLHAAQNLLAGHLASTVGSRAASMARRAERFIDHGRDQGR